MFPAQPSTTRLAVLALVLSSSLGAVTIPVTTTVDIDLDDGECSLREAIVAANGDSAYNGCPGGSGDDRIVFQVATPAAILLDSVLPTILTSITLDGPGSLMLAIDGQDLHRIFHFDSVAGGAVLEVRDITLRHGYASTPPFDSGGVVRVNEGDTAIFRRVSFLDNRAANGAGAILLSSKPPETAVAQIVECLFRGNVAEGPTGGGAVYSAIGSQLAITASTFDQNRADHDNGSGGALFLRGSTVTIDRTTVSGNFANSNGGGLSLAANDAANPLDLTLTDSTITLNVASADADVTGDGGGIYASPSIGAPILLSMANTILADNIDSGVQTWPDIVTSSADVQIVATGWNLIGSNAGPLILFDEGAPNANGDFVGSAASPLDPMLLPLGSNGGRTPTHLPSTSPVSWVVDHGSCPGSPGDQRGWGNPGTGLRIVDVAAVPNHAASDGCDIGAVEAEGQAPSTLDIFADGVESGDTDNWSATVG